MTHNRGRLIAQHLLDPFHNLRSQLGQNFDSPQVLNQLLGFSGPEDDGARIWVDLGYPRESELGHAAFQVCKPRVNHRPCAHGRVFTSPPTLLGDFGQLFDLGDLFLTFLRVEMLCP